MFKKLFGSSNPLHQSGPEIRNLVIQITQQVIGVRWCALLSTKGAFIDHYPAQPAMEQDKISAMSAALWALGERAAKELENGRFHHLLLTASQGKTAVFALNDEYVVAVGLQTAVSWDTTTQKLQPYLDNLLALLNSQ